MPARHVVLMTMAGVCGFAVAAVAIFAGISRVEQNRGAPATQIGGPFTLIDDAGVPVTEAALAGKPSAIYFGYTYCPEICPTTLLDLSRWIAKLGPDADKLNYVFVSIDPERDTPQLMHTYLSSFDKHIRGFTGTPEQVATIAKEYRVYYKKIPTQDGSYVMDHSSIIYLMAANRKFVSTIAYQENDAAALAKLRNLLGTTTPSS